MENRKEETKIRHKSKKAKKDLSQKEDDSKKIEDIQTLFKELDQVEKLNIELNSLKESKNFEQIKHFDLISYLRGTFYSTKIEKFIDFDQTIRKLKKCFENLKCSYPSCPHPAIIAIKGKNEDSTVQYCNDHFNNPSSFTGTPVNINHELIIDIYQFYEIEIQLVNIQDRIDYIQSNQTKYEGRIYDKVRQKVQNILESIIKTLNTMTNRIDIIEESYNSKIINKVSLVNFDDFSFVKTDLAECMEMIRTILSLISTSSSRNQAESLVRVMTDYKNNAFLEEEKIELSNISVSQKIYNSEYKMVNFPAQSFEYIKYFERKIRKICKKIETCQKNIIELVKSFQPFKQILQEQLDQLLIEKKYKMCIAQLTLKDNQFYRDNMEIYKNRPNEFRLDNSEIYNKLKAFKYQPLDFKFQEIQTKTSTNNDGYECVGVGQFKEETNELHGVGIQVDERGDIREGYWMNGKMHGQGRHIFKRGDYYIGEFEDDRFNGNGTFCWKDGRKYVGEFRDDKFNGEGTYCWKDGRIYVGEFKDNRLHGEGTYCSEDGRKYVGHFRDDKKYGQGTQYTAQGEIEKKGYWEDDKYVGDY